MWGDAFPDLPLPSQTCLYQQSQGLAHSYKEAGQLEFGFGEDETTLQLPRRPNPGLQSSASQPPAIWRHIHHFCYPELFACPPAALTDASQRHSVLNPPKPALYLGITVRRCACGRWPREKPWYSARMAVPAPRGKEPARSLLGWGLRRRGPAAAAAPGGAPAGTPRRRGTERRQREGEGWGQRWATAWPPQPSARSDLSARE